MTRPGDADESIHISPRKTFLKNESRPFEGCWVDGRKFCTLDYMIEQRASFAFGFPFIFEIWCFVDFSQKMTIWVNEVNRISVRV